MINIEYAGPNQRVDTINLMRRPFIGKTQHLQDTIQSLDQKWYVEFWIIRYYFLGIEVYHKKKERVRYANGKNGTSATE